MWGALRQRRWLYNGLLLIAWMALIFFLSGRPDLPNPYGGWQGQLLSSGAHVFVFGILALLWLRLLRLSSQVMMAPLDPSLTTTGYP